MIQPSWEKLVPRTNTKYREVNETLAEKSWHVLQTRENSKVGIEEARKTLLQMGCELDGKFLIIPNQEVLNKLTNYVQNNFVDGALMPNLNSFYEDTLLAVSSMRQKSLDSKDPESIEYYPGKGWGVEIAMLGKVAGREKKKSLPYRPHSDFELYGMNFETNEIGGKIGDEKTYTQEFTTIFGSQEIFPSDHTKGLKNLPNSLIQETAEICLLGDVPIKIPQLELLFLDKWMKTESTPRMVGSEVMYDFECLARTYQLDEKKCHEYLEKHVIEPERQKIEANFEKTIEAKINWLNRNIANHLKDKRLETGIEEFNNSWLKQHNYHERIAISDLDTNNQINQEFILKIREKMKIEKNTKLENLNKKHQELNTFFEGMKE